MKFKTIAILAAAVLLLSTADALAGRRRYRASRSHRAAAAVRAPRPAPKAEADIEPPLACEDSCGHVHGIDISHYQGEVFWEAVAENRRLSYVYIKATEGGDHIDDTYERNIRMAHAGGLKVGSYHFYRPVTPQQLQLDNFKTQCLPGEQDLVPMIDVETKNGLSDEAFCDSLLTFLSLVEQAYRQKPLLYTFTNFYNRHLAGKLDGYPLMIAQYNDCEPVLADDRDYTMWQYTNKGRVHGITGRIDKSRFMGDHSLREIRYRH